MARKHTLVAALALGLAAVLGVVALGRTLGLGAASSHASDAVVAKRMQQLDRFEAALRRQLKATPSVPTAAPPAAAPGAQRVLYVRPKPTVVTVHRSHGDDDRYEALAEHDGGGESDD
jgi:hypothetical protein